MSASGPAPGGEYQAGREAAGTPGAANGGDDGGEGAEGPNGPGQGHLDPGAGTGASTGASSADAVLVAVKQEVAKLREVFVAIQDALEAALQRLECLEGRLVDVEPVEDGRIGARSLDGSVRPPMAGRVPRSVPPWKLGAWQPPAGSRALGASYGNGDGGGAVTGDTLRSRREALGISQAAVAHAAHCSRGLVAEVERGKRRSAQTLAHLASTLDRLEEQSRRN
jgi:hypothetical protein